MARREKYTEVLKERLIRPPHVAGMGDVIWREFQCLNPECEGVIRKKDVEINMDNFCITCESCGYAHKTGDIQVVYGYKLIDKRDQSEIAAGIFSILHDDYISEASKKKYCIICGALKPLDRFDRHSSRKSGRQGECNLCKRIYNGIKNGTRLPEQHREASQKRRLYVEFDSSNKLDINSIYRKFNNSCFRCAEDLSEDLKADVVSRAGNLDHTLPVYYLWPLTTNNATLLCKRCNGEKAEKWPSFFYTDIQLRSLSVLTGMEYRLLRGDPEFNPEAIKALKEPEYVEALFTKFASYPDELLRLRNRILEKTDFDFLSVTGKISPEWIERANNLR